MKLGILGCGGIAHTAAKTMTAVEGAERWAVGSRSLEKAKAFAEEFGFARAYGSYEELAQDPEVELIYIATPHSHHYQYAKLCLENGKHVLCEKAFTMNADQAKALRDLAQEKGLFLAEAIWPRYMPSRKIIRNLIDGGAIGKTYTLTASLSDVISTIPRLYDPALGGGALLDVGVYGINFALMCFGHQVSRVESAMQLADTGVDGQESITLFFEDGRMAVLTHGIYGRADKQGIVYGDKGYLVVDNINNPQAVDVFDGWGRKTRHIDMPEQFTGYEYEYRECLDAIAAGKKEAPSMPLEDTVYVMELMDRVRKPWNLKYPCE